MNGVLNIDKASGLTSHDVVAHVRQLLTTHYQLQTKVGHTGTLDPLATGVLLVALGSATRLIQFTHAWDKEYEAVFTLGATSDTDDVTGRITKSKIPMTKKIPRAKIKKALGQFKGTIQQILPAYSAVKIRGKKLYEYARAGLPANTAGESPPRSVTIYAIDILQYAYPLLTIRIRCSTGTYIRSLARDLGKILGTGAYVSSLRRTRIGQFDINNSVSLNKLSTGFQQYIHSPASLVRHLPRLTLTSHNIKMLRQGKRVEVATVPAANTPLALIDAKQRLIGIGIADPATGLLSPKINLEY